jgi:anthranilate synthase component 2
MEVGISGFEYFNFVKLRLLFVVRILIIDFYDSFVYNLVHYFQSLGIEVAVLCDHDVPLGSLDFLQEYAGVVLSPGPGLPSETQSMMRVISYCQSSIPVLGVCLGMQGIGVYLGGTISNLNAVRHGISLEVYRHREGMLLTGITFPMEVGLYHSWSIVDLPDEYLVAKDSDGVTMAIESDSHLLYGVQFHPESIMTSQGKKIIENVGSIFFNIFTKRIL